MNTPELPTTEARPPQYNSRRNTLQQRQRQLVSAARAVAEQLEEPNVASIIRLTEIFGEQVVRDIANRARERFAAAQAQGAEAYQPQPNGSDVATYNGAPRSCGGVFFYLARAHATALGLDWLGLCISPPRTQPPSSGPGHPPGRVVPAAAKVPAVQQPQVTANPTPAAQTNVTVQKPTVAQAQSVSEPAPVKPNRIKATVVGTAMGEPKPTDQPGVLQLVFDVEMSPTMPKGLPTLGRSRVIVLCTEKQYRHVAPAGAATSRLIVDGEVATTLSTAGKPLLLLVCTRLTTPELEQAKHSA